MKYFLYPLILGSLFFACEYTEDTTATDTPEKMIDSTSVENTLITTNSFIIEYNEDETNPISEVVLDVDGVLHEVAKVSGCVEKIEKSEYSEYDIPADAVEACGTYWAGAGDYFYILANASEVKLYQGWIDETQEVLDYNWTLKEVIARKRS